MRRDPDEHAGAAEDPVLEELAGWVADGAEVDWSRASSETDRARHRLLGHLRTVATLADVHRRPAPPGSQATDAGTGDRTWAHLRVLELVGQGAFGRVYRAWDTRLDREVALKLLPAGTSMGERDTSAIIGEGRLLARVRHPNVVTIHGAEQQGSEIGLWMEFVRGRTLEAMVAEGVRFSPGEVASIGIDLAGAVAAVHAAGLLHRDIKAQNVMRAGDGRVVLMDFGAGRDQRAESGDLAGTPLYLAPEIFRGARATPQSDIYSLGVLLHFLLTGSFPVQGRTTADLRQAHEAGARTPLAAIRPRVPARLARLIDRATDPDPARRPQTAEELLGGLQTHARRPVGRLVVAAMVATIAVAAMWMMGREPAPPVIAVLPFQPVGTESEVGLVAEGLTYELVRGLGEIDGLRVRSTAPAVATAGGPAPGNEQDPDFVLDGSVTATSGRLRVSARLVRVSDGIAVWSDTFDPTGVESSAVPHDISLAIVNRLRIRLGRGQRRYETGLDTYYLFLQARGLQSKRHPQYANQAVELFTKVLAEDPSYAPAAAGLASALSTVARQTLNADLTTLRPKLEAAALDAIRLDPMLAEAQAALGVLHALDGQWADAEASFTKALELNRSLTTIHGDFALSTLLPMGRSEEGVALLEEARSIDPQSLGVRLTLAQAQVNAGRYAEAIESARWVLDRDPTYPYAANYIGQALVLSGRPEEALRVYEEIGNVLGAGYVYGVLGRREDAEAVAVANPDNPGLQMFVYCGLGDKERAFEALERLVVSNPWRAAIWMLRGEAAILRDDPRFGAIRRRLGLPE